MKFFTVHKRAVQTLSKIAGYLTECKVSNGLSGINSGVFTQWFKNRSSSVAWTFFFSQVHSVLCL